MFVSSIASDVFAGIILEILMLSDLNSGFCAGFSFHEIWASYPCAAHNSAYCSTIGDSPVMKMRTGVGFKFALREVVLVALIFTFETFGVVFLFVFNFLFH